MGKGIIYGVIIQSADGGQQMNSYREEKKAREEAEDIIKTIKVSGTVGVKVYLSELLYDYSKNRLTTSEIINKDSELLHQS